MTTEKPSEKPPGVAAGFTGWATPQPKRPTRQLEPTLAGHGNYPPHVVAWANSPPFTKVHVSELATQHVPFYLANASLHYLAGLHVSSEAQREEIRKLAEQDGGST